jgi:hypothetical protein
LDRDRDERIARNNWLLYGKAGVAWASTSCADAWARPFGLCRNGQRDDPDRVDGRDRPRMGIRPELVAQGRVRPGSPGLLRFKRLNLAQAPGRSAVLVEIARLRFI